MIVNNFKRASSVISNSLISFCCRFSITLSRLCCNLKPNIKKKIKNIYARYEKELYTHLSHVRFDLPPRYRELKWIEDECELYKAQPSMLCLNYRKFCGNNRRMKDFSCSALYKPQFILKNVNSSIKRY